MYKYVYMLSISYIILVIFSRRICMFLLVISSKHKFIIPVDMFSRIFANHPTR